MLSVVKTLSSKYRLHHLSLDKIQLVQDAALLQVSQISALSPPTGHNLTMLQDWLKRPKHGNGFLKGLEAKTWDVEKGPAGHVTLAKFPPKQGALSEALHKIIPGFYHRHIGHRWKKPTEDDIFEYDDSHLDRTARGVSTSLSALLTALYYVRSPSARLGPVLAFTTIFATVLQLVARAKLTEVFVATAA